MQAVKISRISHGGRTYTHSRPGSQTDRHSSCPANGNIPPVHDSCIFFFVVFLLHLSSPLPSSLFPLPLLPRSDSDGERESASAPSPAFHGLIGRSVRICGLHLGHTHGLVRDGGRLPANCLLRLSVPFLSEDRYKTYVQQALGVFHAALEGRRKRGAAGGGAGGGGGRRVWVRLLGVAQIGDASGHSARSDGRMG